MTIEELAKVLGVSVEMLRALPVMLAQSAMVLEVRALDAKIATVEAEAAKVAADYAVTVEQLREQRRELQAKIDATMGA